MSKRSEVNPALKGSSDPVRLQTHVKGSTFYWLWQKANLGDANMNDVIDALISLVDGDEALTQELTVKLREMTAAKVKASVKRRAATRVALKLGDIALAQLDEAYAQTLKDLPPIAGGELADVKHAAV